MINKRVIDVRLVKSGEVEDYGNHKTIRKLYEVDVKTLFGQRTEKVIYQRYWDDKGEVQNFWLYADGGRAPEWVTFQRNIEIEHAHNYEFMFDGELIKVYNLAKFCRDNSLSGSCMHNLWHGKREEYKGYTCVKLF